MAVTASPIGFSKKTLPSTPTTFMRKLKAVARRAAIPTPPPICTPSMAIPYRAMTMGPRAAAMARVRPPSTVSSTPAAAAPLMSQPTRAGLACAKAWKRLMRLPTESIRPTMVERSTSPPALLELNT
ncbi:hypothetical protein D3C72_1783150 [compost metagenome]